MNQKTRALKKPELLLPAGTFTRLKIALMYGADAVYVGLPALSLRASVGLTMDELIEGSRLMHEAGKKIYVAVNLFSKNQDYDKLPEITDKLRAANPDGVIVADPGVFSYIRQQLPELKLHISTQANISSWMTVNFWQQIGASLCVLARETTFAETLEIRKKCPDIGLEMFIHGSMCMSYSGRCLLSAFMAGRSANQGKCANSCRWEYNLYLEEAVRPGQYMKVEEDKHGSYILNSKDLCLLPRLPEILSAGINSLKIEGRNKSDYYVAQVSRVYRLAIDDWFANPETWQAEPYMEELLTLQNRGYTQGFFNGPMDTREHNTQSSLSVGTAQNVGIVTGIEQDGSIRMGVRHKINNGDTVEFLLPDKLQTLSVTLQNMRDGFNGEATSHLSPGKSGQEALIPANCFPTDEYAKITPLMVVRKNLQLQPQSP